MAGKKRDVTFLMQMLLFGAKQPTAQKLIIKSCVTFILVRGGKGGGRDGRRSIMEFFIYVL